MVGVIVGDVMWLVVVFLLVICYWVFDMDGILIVVMYDFDWIKCVLGILIEEDILVYLVGLLVEQVIVWYVWLLEYEWVLVEVVQFVLGVVVLVCVLQLQGCWFGILICNVCVLVEVMLQVIGLGDVFGVDDIIGCDEVELKLLLVGLLYFVWWWQVDFVQVVMVGDYCFDFECGCVVGICILLVNVFDNLWLGMVCWYLVDCCQVLEIW